MTTNHRPTLESKRGRAHEIKDSITHSRAQRGQTSLKLRLDVGSQIDPVIAKRAFEELQGPNKKPKKVLDSESVGEEQSIDSEVSEDSTEQKEADKEQVSTVDNDEKENGSGEHDSEKDDSESEGDSDSDSNDSDTQALMEQLAIIRKEKEEKLRKEKLKKEAEALKGNPLLANADAPPKKSWRTATAFGRAKKSSLEYTTNSTESQTHKNFLSKYVR